MRQLNRTEAGIGESRPIKVLQFGGGNFLRGFADWMMDVMNERTDFCADVQIIQTISSRHENPLHEQEGLYHLATKGFLNREVVSDMRLITSVRGTLNPNESPEEFFQLARMEEIRFVISNTTEAGIVFKEEPFAGVSETFPGKLTMFLLERYGRGLPGLVMLPCELLEKNGKLLRDIVLRYSDHWQLPRAFQKWVVNENIFCNTLVDRIVPGFSKQLSAEIGQQTGYVDKAVVMAEPFYSWIIEGPPIVAEIFPAQKCGLNVEFVRDIAPYHKRKVRILNGAHTSMMPVAYLNGVRTVREAISDETLHHFITSIIDDEIIPTLDFQKEELKRFSGQTVERFKNPFIEHQLISIALNSVSKFKVRVLPTILEYHKRYNKLPEGLVHSFAALIIFYKGEWKGENIPLKDNDSVLDFFKAAWQHNEIHEVVRKVLSNVSLWDHDLTTIPGLEKMIVDNIRLIKSSEI